MTKLLEYNLYTEKCDKPEVWISEKLQDYLFLKEQIILPNAAATIAKCLHAFVLLPITGERIVQLTILAL